ncbi:MAG TPA: GtrA family protein [Bavariicoccus seileri]|uniref:GtrA family protein n=1 Tax=Bavariicoccus seileri TaxID=549685 RepID=A0A3D4S4X3_9ENTE|nr:GtrA family protein [Bavariicoccus seileri]HCS93869.1 GtrA family protein [Bavariicoccus seileri]
MKKLIEQLMKFGVVGVIASLIDFGVLYVLTEYLGINYLVSSTISFLASVIFNYILSVKWVFVTAKTNKTKELLLFTILSAVGLVINNLLMWVFVEKAGVYYMLAKVIATVVVMLYNFISRKILIEDKGAKSFKEML